MQDTFWCWCEHSEASINAHRCCRLLPQQARQRRPCSAAPQPLLCRPEPCPHRLLCPAGYLPEENAPAWHHMTSHRKVCTFSIFMSLT